MPIGARSTTPDRRNLCDRLGIGGLHAQGLVDRRDRRATMTTTPGRSSESRRWSARQIVVAVIVLAVLVLMFGVVGLVKTVLFGIVLGVVIGLVLRFVRRK
jgi:Na+/H+ antiporter NhaC